MLIIINAGQFCSLKQYKTIWGFSLKNTCCAANLIIIIYNGFVCKEQGFPKENHPLPQLCLLSTNNKAEQIRTRYLQPGRRDVTENLIRIFHPAVLSLRTVSAASLGVTPGCLGPALKVWLWLHNQSTTAATMPTCRKYSRFSLPFFKIKKNQNILLGFFAEVMVVEIFFIFFFFFKSLSCRRALLYLTEPLWLQLMNISHEARSHPNRDLKQKSSVLGKAGRRKNENSATLSLAADSEPSFHYL